MNYKLGKLPASNQVKFKLSSFIDPSAFPKLPKSFGHEGSIVNWQVLGNDNYGDCVLAGAAHETNGSPFKVGDIVNAELGLYGDYNNYVIASHLQ